MKAQFAVEGIPASSLVGAAWFLIRFFLLVCMCLGFPISASSQDTGQKIQSIPELKERLGQFETDRSRAMEPFQAARDVLNSKYMDALEGILRSASEAGNLDQALVIREEIQRVKAKKPTPEKAQSQGCPKFARLHAILTEELQKISRDESKEIAKLEQDLIQDLEGLETDLTRAGNLDGAIVVRAVREKTAENLGEKAALPPADPNETIADANLDRLKRKGGKLRISGVLKPGITANHDEESNLPGDFVAVHAFRTGWMALRANGRSIVLGLDRNLTTKIYQNDWKIELANRGYDGWCYTQDNRIERIVNWENKGSATIRNPIAIAAGHAVAVLLNSRGDVEVVGGGDPTLATPAKILRSSVREAFSSKHTIMIVDEAGKAGAWHYREGRIVVEPKLDVALVRNGDGGEDHYVFLDQHGMVQAFSIDNRFPGATQVPNDLGSVLQVKAGGLASAAQLANGTWRAWGESPFLNKETPKAGVAIDLDIYFGEGADYVIWIEP